MPWWNGTRAFNIWGCGQDWDSVSTAGVTQMSEATGRDCELWVSLSREIRPDWYDRLLVPAPFSPI